MTQDYENRPDFDPSTAMRAMGEQDRTSEAKEQRDRLVESITGFLQPFSAAKERGDLVKIGEFTFPFADEPLLTQTILGRTSLGFRSVAESITPGVYVGGDGEFEPVRLQAVFPSQTGLTIYEVTGSDPMLPSFDERSFSTLNSQQKYGVLCIRGSKPEQDTVVDFNYTYSVGGDGNVIGPVREQSDGSFITDFSERGIANSVAAIGHLDDIAEILQIVPKQE